MRVSTKELFSLISKSDTKNVKEVLDKLAKVDKKAEANTPNLETAKNTNAKELIETLLKDLSNTTKTKESVLANLKQNDIPKQMQNTTRELTSLLNLIKADKTLSKFVPILEKLLLHVKDIKPENLKTELSKSGVFMESKLASSKTQIMPAPLKEVLRSLKELILKNHPKQESLHVKSTDKGLVETFSSLVKQPQHSSEISKQINQTLAKLENILKQNIPIKDSNVKEVLANLKEAIKNEMPQKSLHVKTIDLLLNSKKADKGFVETLTNLVKDIKNTTNLLQNSLHVKTIDKLLNSPQANKEFMQDIKALLSNLKNTKHMDKPIIDITAKLETLVKNSELINSKIQNSPQIAPKEMQKVANEIKQVMNELKILVSKENIKNTPLLLEKSKEIMQIAEQVLKMPEFFPKGLSKATVSEQLQQIVNILKSELIKSDVKNSLHVEVSKLTQNLETVIKEQIATKNIVPNQKLLLESPIKNQLVNDMKATLLNIKHELSTSTLPTHREIIAQVDRLLTQIDYFQLVSLSSNSQTTYLPFSWDSLEGGQISLKKLKENRFFCEINLTLKEYGKIDLMIMLFEDIHVNISVFAEKKEFTTLVQENLATLKQGINKLGLIPSSVQLFDALKDKQLKEDTRNFVSSTQLGSGLNIEV